MPTSIERHPLTADGCVELAVLERSGFDESRHLGAGIVVDQDGTEIDRIGDPSASVYPRSTMKPFQALAVRRLGARFAAEELVLSTASHSGTVAHQSIVTNMLTSYDHVEADLGCPPEFASDRDTARTMPAPRRLTMNCSGKHAAMLAACRINGWDARTYLTVDHPLQQAVIATVQEATGEHIDLIGVDGCGAPVLPLTLHGLARGIARIVRGDDREAHDITNAVLQHPWALDGVGRANTVTIERLGLFAKLGAEGVMVMGVPGRGAVAVKTLDGSQRAGTMGALTLLARNGLVPSADAEATMSTLADPVLGGGVPVGRVRPGSGLL